MIEQHEGGIILTGDAIMAARFRARIGALRIEIKTGMRHSKYSILQQCRNDYGLKGNRKRVLEQMERIWEQNYGELPMGSELQPSATLAPMDTTDHRCKCGYPATSLADLEGHILTSVSGTDDPSGSQEHRAAR